MKTSTAPRTPATATKTLEVLVYASGRYVRTGNRQRWPVPVLRSLRGE